jgi:hypothetical protein
MTQIEWPDHEKLLWLMTELNNWDKTENEILQRALHFWNISSDFITALQEIDGTMAKVTDIDELKNVIENYLEESV